MIFKRGKVYWFEFRFDGERVRRSTHKGNAEIARDAEAAERMRRVKGEHGTSRKEKAPTLEEFKDTFVSWVKSDKDNAGTREFYETCYTRLCEYRPLANARLEKIDEKLIEDFKLWVLQRSVTRTTVNRYLSTLKKALRYAWRQRRVIP